MTENTWQADSARFEGGPPESADSPAPERPDASSPIDIPTDALILIPMRNLVLFPGLVVPLTVGRDSSVAAAQTAARQERRVGIVLQRQPDTEAPTLEALQDRFVEIATETMQENGMLHPLQSVVFTFVQRAAA